MALKIQKKHLELIKAYGVESYPNECCGFLLGKPNNGDKEVLSTFPSVNAREEREKYHRFLITADAYLQCEKFAKVKNLDIIGFTILILMLKPTRLLMTLNMVGHGTLMLSCLLPITKL